MVVKPVETTSYLVETTGVELKRALACVGKKSDFIVKQQDAALKTSFFCSLSTQAITTCAGESSFKRHYKLAVSSGKFIQQPNKVNLLRKLILKNDSNSFNLIQNQTQFLKDYRFVVDNKLIKQNNSVAFVAKHYLFKTTADQFEFTVEETNEFKGFYIEAQKGRFNLESEPTSLIATRRLSCSGLSS